LLLIKIKDIYKKSVYLKWQSQPTTQPTTKATSGTEMVLESQREEDITR